MKKFIASILIVALSVLLAACGGADKAKDNKTEGEASKNISLGATAGPFSDMLKEGVIPGLEEKGYTVKLVEFSDYIQPNNALDSGSIDANLFQHSVYLENFAKENKMDLVGIITVPTAPMGFYSEKIKEISAIPDGARITIPNDPSNAARALLTLQNEGLIKIDPNIEELKASEKDVVENTKKLELQPLDSAGLPRAVESADISAVPGNFAVAAGMNLNDALFLEDMPDKLRNVVAVRAEDKDSQLAKDIIAVIESEQFEKLIDDKFTGFGKPEWMTQR